MSKDLKAIIISVIMIAMGMFTMFLFKQDSTGRTIGGAMFIIGCLVFSLSLYNIIKK